MAKTTSRTSKIEAELSKLDKLGTDLSSDGKKPVDELDWELIKVGNAILASSTEIRKLVKALTKKDKRHG